MKTFEITEHLKTSLSKKDEGFDTVLSQLYNLNKQNIESSLDTVLDTHSIYSLDDELVTSLKRVYGGFLGIDFKKLINAVVYETKSKDRYFVLLPTLDFQTHPRKVISYYMFQSNEPNSDKALNWFEQSRILSKQMDYEF